MVCDRAELLRRAAAAGRQRMSGTSLVGSARAGVCSIGTTCQPHRSGMCVLCLLNLKARRGLFCGRVFRIFAPDMLSRMRSSRLEERSSRSFVSTSGSMFSGYVEGRIRRLSLAKSSGSSWKPLLEPLLEHLKESKTWQLVVQR